MDKTEREEEGLVSWIRYPPAAPASSTQASRAGACRASDKSSQPTSSTSTKPSRPLEHTQPASASSATCPELSEEVIITLRTTGATHAALPRCGAPVRRT